MFIIAGAYRRKPLETPKSQKTRPTANRLRQALFNICQSSIEGAHFLDIFAGSGAMGLEALSRGASFATFIESDNEALRCISNNIRALKVEKQTRILRGDVFAMLKRLEGDKQSFDIIYADPPYKTEAPGSSFYYSSLLVQWIDEHLLLSKEGTFFIEEDCHSLPQLDPLSTICLKSSRCHGKAGLQQYIKTVS